MAAADWEYYESLESASEDETSAEAAREDTLIHDPEVWMDYWSEELLTLWHLLRDQCTANGYAILDTCAFPDFTQFCFRMSSGRPPAA